VCFPKKFDFFSLEMKKKIMFSNCLVVLILKIIFKKLKKIILIHLEEKTF